MVSWLALALSQAGGESGDLPKIGPAPAFNLTTQEGARLALKDLRGKVVAVTFIFASCTDTCPADREAGRAAGTPRHGFRGQGVFCRHHRGSGAGYAEGAQALCPGPWVNLAGWAFLTGTPAEIQQVARQYGIYSKKTPRGAVDHTFLTSLIDPSGTLRVQYLGVRFDPDELLHDRRPLCARRPGHDSGYPGWWRACRRACMPSSWWPSWSLPVCSSPSVPLAWEW